VKIKFKVFRFIKEQNKLKVQITMTNDLGPSQMNNYTPASYRSADVFGGNHPLPTPSGFNRIIMKFQ
jgi:hypothetical protein